MLKNKALNRFFDITVSLLFLSVFAPFFLLVTIVIKLDSNGPIFFRQSRVGKKGRLFSIIKLRTMYQKEGPALTLSDDSRITRVGKMLRISKIDEWPQFINVLMGNMSIVGPRPEIPEVVALYKKSQNNILKAKPGITSPASIKFKEERILSQSKNRVIEDYVDKVLPEKLKYDLDYFQTNDLATDMLVIWRTITGLFIRR